MHKFIFKAEKYLSGLISFEPEYNDIVIMQAPLIMSEKTDENDEFTTLTNRLKKLEK